MVTNVNPRVMTVLEQQSLETKRMIAARDKYKLGADTL